MSLSETYPGKTVQVPPALRSGGISASVLEGTNLGRYMEPQDLPLGPGLSDTCRSRSLASLTCIAPTPIVHSSSTALEHLEPPGLESLATCTASSAEEAHPEYLSEMAAT